MPVRGSVSSSAAGPAAAGRNTTQAPAVVTAPPVAASTAGGAPLGARDAARAQRRAVDPHELGVGEPPRVLGQRAQLGRRGGR